MSEEYCLNIKYLKTSQVRKVVLDAFRKLMYSDTYVQGAEEVRALVRCFLQDRDKMGILFGLLEEKEEAQMSSVSRRNLPFYTKNKIRTYNYLLEEQGLHIYMSEYLRLVGTKAEQLEGQSGYQLSVQVGQAIRKLSGEDTTQYLGQQLVQGILGLSYRLMDQSEESAANLVLKVVENTGGDFMADNIAPLLERLCLWLDKEESPTVLLESVLHLVLNNQSQLTAPCHSAAVHRLVQLILQKHGVSVDSQVIKLSLDIIYSLAICDDSLLSHYSHPIQALINNASLHNHRPTTEAAQNLLHFISKSIFQHSKPSKTPSQPSSAQKEDLTQKLQAVIKQQEQIIEAYLHKEQEKDRVIQAMQRQLDEMAQKQNAQQHQIDSHHNQMALLEQKIKHPPTEAQPKMSQSNGFHGYGSFKKSASRGDKCQSMEMPRPRDLPREPAQSYLPRDAPPNYLPQKEIVIDLEDDQVFLSIIAETDRIAYYLDKVDSQSLESLMGKLSEYLQREEPEENVLGQVLQWLDVFSNNTAYLQIVSTDLLLDIQGLLGRLPVQAGTRQARLVSARLTLFLQKE